MFVLYCHWPKYSFFWYPFLMLPVELLEPNCKSSSLSIDRKYKNEQWNEEIIIYTSQQKKRYKDFFLNFKYIFMLKPKQMFIIIYVNVCVKRVYPHKTNNNILFRYEKIPESQFPSHDRIRHLNQLRSLIVLSTKVNSLPFWKFEFLQERRCHGSVKMTVNEQWVWFRLEWLTRPL